MREPNFVIAGAQRSGSTWLAQTLDQHPDVYLAKPLRPEPKWFLAEPTPEQDKEWYLRTWFADAGDQAAVGEKSTSYLESAAAARRMDRCFPGMRVVLILRHPVERALSHYLFSRASGMETEPLARALELEGKRAREPRDGVSVDPFAYVARGHYVEYLRPYWNALGKDRIHVLITESLRQGPQVVLPDLFRFLRVDPGFVPEPFAERPNAQPWNDLELDDELLERLLQRFQQSNRELERLLGRDLSFWDRPTETLERALR